MLGSEPVCPVGWPGAPRGCLLVLLRPGLVFRFVSEEPGDVDFGKDEPRFSRPNVFWKPLEAREDELRFVGCGTLVRSQFLIDDARQ